MENKKKVICAMSGGVDSSVAAALLLKQGYEVIGVFMKLWSENRSGLSTALEVKENVCCSYEAATAARKVCQKLKIPFYILNFEKEFKKAVVDYFVREYEAGRTPNPCVICNRDIKGEILLKKVDELGGDFLATGHYTRITSENAKIQIPNDKQIPNPKFKIPNYYLYKSKDKNKDQTYFLWMLTQKHLERLLFPVGDYTKTEVRKMAKKWHLPTATRRESQGICFIPDRDVSGFLMRYAKKLTEPGDIVNIDGKKLGIHNGLINYTIGQREHLGLGGPKAYFVLQLNSRTNTLVVGQEADLYKKALFCDKINWISKKPKLPAILGAQIRYGHPVEKAKVTEHQKGILKVKFTKPQRAITPGQSIVFYDGEKVLGGAVIKGVV